MALTPGSSDGVFNGVTPVDIVAAPGASIQRLIKSITVRNNDTVPHTVQLNLDVAGTNRLLPTAVLAAGESAEFTDLVLDATNKKIEGALAGAHTTTAPSFVTMHADKS